MTTFRSKYMPAGYLFAAWVAAPAHAVWGATGLCTSKCTGMPYLPFTDCRYVQMTAGGQRPIGLSSQPRMSTSAHNLSHTPRRLDSCARSGSSLPQMPWCYPVIDADSIFTKPQLAELDEANRLPCVSQPSHPLDGPLPLLNQLPPLT